MSHSEAATQLDNASQHRLLFSVSTLEHWSSRCLLKIPSSTKRSPQQPQTLNKERISFFNSGSHFLEKKLLETQKLFQQKIKERHFLQVSGSFHSRRFRRNAKIEFQKVFQLPVVKGESGGRNVSICGACLCDVPCSGMLDFAECYQWARSHGTDGVPLHNAHHVQNQFWDNFDGGVTQVAPSMHRKSNTCLDCL